MCLRMGWGGENVGISNRRGARCMSPLARTRGVREVSATCDSDGIAEADSSLMFPEVLTPAPGEGITARLIVPHVGKVLQGAPVGKDVEECSTTRLVEVPPHVTTIGRDAVKVFPLLLCVHMRIVIRSLVGLIVGVHR